MVIFLTETNWLYDVRICTATHQIDGMTLLYPRNWHASYSDFLNWLIRNIITDLKDSGEQHFVSESLEWAIVIFLLQVKILPRMVHWQTFFMLD